MPSFRKKPITVEAVNFLGLDSFGLIVIDGDQSPDWLVEARQKEWGEPGSIAASGDDLRIFTLEGEMTAEPGDWLVRGIHGEIYPVKNDIFDKTYEAA